MSNLGGNDKKLEGHNLHTSFHFEGFIAIIIISIDIIIDIIIINIIIDIKTIIFDIITIFYYWYWY